MNEYRQWHHGGTGKPRRCYCECGAPIANNHCAKGHICEVHMTVDRINELRAAVNAALPDAIIIDNLMVWTGARKVST